MKALFFLPFLFTPRRVQLRSGNRGRLLGMVQRSLFTYIKPLLVKGQFCGYYITSNARVHLVYPCSYLTHIKQAVLWLYVKSIKRKKGKAPHNVHFTLKYFQSILKSHNCLPSCLLSLHKVTQDSYTKISNVLT